MSGLAARLLRVLEHPLAVAFVGLALAVPVALALRAPVLNGDIAWHLALGRWISTNAAIPTADPFTYTALGAPMVAHEWLSQWLYWQWTELTNLHGLRWAHAGLAAGTLGLAFCCFRRAGAPPSIALLGTAAFITMVESRFQVRPQMVNPIFGIALFTALFHSRAKLRASEIGFAGLAVALWTNLHSAAVLFPALLWGYALVDLAERKLTRRPSWPRDVAFGEPRRLVALAAVCSAAVLATPNHVRLLPYVIESGRVNADSSIEWLSIAAYFPLEGNALLIGAWMAIVASSVLASALALREGRGWAAAALALACALAPLQSIRFSWLAFVPIAYVAGELARWLARRTAPIRDSALLACGLGALAAALVGLGRPGVPPGVPFFNSASFPIGSVRLLRDVPLTGRVFARPEWGGFITLLLDERVPIFADGRWVTIGEKVVREAHIMATGRPRALFLLDQWDIDVVVAERGWAGSGRKRERRGWQWIRAFAGYNSAIWLRRGERGRANRQAFTAYYAAHGIPFDRKHGFLPAAALRANPEWAREHGVWSRSIRHFLPDGRRSERGFEVVAGEPPPASR